MKNKVVFLTTLFFLVGCSTRLFSPTPTISTGVTISAIPSTSSPTSNSQLTIKPTLTTTSPRTPTSIPSTLTPTIELYEQIAYSPNGLFVAKLYGEFAYPSGIPTIEISKLDGSMSWEIPFQGKLPMGDPRRSLVIYQWAGDSSALYFYYAFSYDGAPTFWDGFDLQKFDVKTGQVQPLVISEKLMAFAFSSDEQFLAYTRDQDLPCQIIIRNLSTGTEITSPIAIKSGDYTQVGWISWSPSGAGVLFHTWEAHDESMQAIYLDMRNMTQKILLDFVSEEYWFDGWDEEDHPRYFSYSKGIISIDLLTGTISYVGTPTPTPSP